MRAAAIRQQLLTGSDEDLERRRKVMLLSAIGLIDFSVISLYQSGVVKKLPDLPGKIFDSNKVNAARDAYQMGAPDGTISNWIYATNMVLASYGGTAQSGRKPVHDALLGASLMSNAAGAVYYLLNMAFKQKKICPYCIAGAAINIASAVIIAPTLKKSFKKIFGK